MGRQKARETSIEVAPLLIIGMLTLVALSLWLWRGSNLQTVVRRQALAMVPGGSPTRPTVPTTPPTSAQKPRLEVPTLPNGVISAHWREVTTALPPMTSEDGAASKNSARQRQNPIKPGEKRKKPISRAALLRVDGSELGLTLHPRVQRAIERRLRRVRVPYGAAVLMDVHSGAIKAWVEHQEPGVAAGQGHGLTRASAPAASIFKVVTAAALLESGAKPETETCFHGGHRAISAKLLRNSVKDTVCENLAMSLARSSNVAFGKQAVKRLSAATLTATAEDLFFDRALPFDTETFASHVAIDEQDLPLARAAAGFVGTTLSPLHGVALAAAVANDGLLMRPHLVSSDSLQPQLRREPEVLGRVLSGAVARDLREMMALTVTDGTGRKQFKSWPKSLAHIQVAGKTGTLVRRENGVYRSYTWFIGFAPAEDPQIAVAALAVNGKRWRIRGPSLARHALASWFLYGDSATTTP